METALTEPQKRWLTTVFGHGAGGAAAALSQWLGRPVALTVSAVEEADLAEASEWLGPGDELVAACIMPVSGGLEGSLLFVFDDRAGLALADLLLRQEPGTATGWDEMEQSAANETVNIVGCAYLNALAAHVPAADGGPSVIIPGPPAVRHEFAASLLEFALMDQAVGSDRVLLINTEFASESLQLDWALLFAPTGASLRALLDGASGIDGPL